MKGASLVAYGYIDASVTNIPLATFIPLPLFDLNGNPIASGVLPANCSRTQFLANVSKNFWLGVKNGVGPGGYCYAGAGQQDDFEVSLPEQQVGIKAFDGNITEGIFAILFYA